MRPSLYAQCMSEKKVTKLDSKGQCYRCHGQVKVKYTKSKTQYQCPTCKKFGPSQNTQAQQGETKTPTPQSEKEDKLVKRILVWDRQFHAAVRKKDKKQICSKLVDLSLIHISEPTRPY